MVVLETRLHISLGGVFSVKALVNYLISEWPVNPAGFYTFS